jgi:hypothetical protein
MSPTARSSIAACRNASNVFGSNSARMVSSALRRSRDRICLSSGSGGAASSGRALGRARAEVVADLVHGDRPQPAAERVLRALLPESRDPGRHRPEHLLDHVRAVVGLQAGVVTPVRDERRIEADHAVPGGRVVRLEARDQAPRRGGAQIV